MHNFAARYFDGRSPPEVIFAAHYNRLLASYTLKKWTDQTLNKPIFMKLELASLQRHRTDAAIALRVRFCSYTVRRTQYDRPS